MNNQEKQEDSGFNIEITPELESGVYSNLAMVMHSQSEFVLDFIQMIPQHKSSKVRSRVIMTPDNMKRLLRVMIGNMNAFENEYGEVILPEDVANNNNMDGDA